MKIYHVAGHYFADSQATVDLAQPDANNPNPSSANCLGVWVVGGVVEANQRLADLHAQFAATWTPYFTVCEEVPSEDGLSISWKSVDLTKEQPNSTKTYRIFNQHTGEHMRAVGKTLAQRKIDLAIRAFSEASGNKITPLSELPPKVAPAKYAKWRQKKPV